MTCARCGMKATNLQGIVTRSISLVHDPEKGLQLLCENCLMTMAGVIR